MPGGWAPTDSQSVPNGNKRITFVIQICFVIRHSDFVILHIRGIRGSSCKLVSIRVDSWLSALSENPFRIISGLLTAGSTFQPFNRRFAMREMRKGAKSFYAR